MKRSRLPLMENQAKGNKGKTSRFASPNKLDASTKADEGGVSINTK